MPIRDNCEAIYEKCTSALAAFLKNAGFDEVVIGLSGGLDSSLVAVMAVDVLGSSNVHGVLLPGPYSSTHSVEDALELASNLDIATVTLSINSAYSAFCTGIEGATGKKLEGLASENAQARCRMVYLMAMSNLEGWLLLNTGNKSEAAMGYSTLYGDTAGAFAPIGALYKTEILELAKWRNEKAASEDATIPIPENVLSKPPSAELSSGQTDEESMGISYDDLDAILMAYIENGLGVSEIMDMGYPESKVSMVIDRYKSYEFKRAMEPPAAEV